MRIVDLWIKKVDFLTNTNITVFYGLTSLCNHVIIVVDMGVDNVKVYMLYSR